MKLGFLLAIALRSLRRNPLRTALTTLGIMIGVASVVAMVAISQGATASIQAAVASMGSNVLSIQSGSSSSRGVSWGAGSQPTLTPQDAEAIASECHSIRAVSPVIRHKSQIVHGDRNWVPNSMEGVGAAYPDVLGLRAVEGGWFNEGDERSAAKVCLLGLTIVNELFPGERAVGKTIRIGNVPFEIIGVLERRGSNAWGRDQDDVVIMPWTVMRKRLTSSNSQHVDSISVSAVSAAAIPKAMDEITALLRERHRIQDGDMDDFNIRDMSQVADAMSQTSKVMGGLLAAIASISLLVGGIGIMNIMLVTVSERTREIGIRLAVGARAGDILMQFLVEAVVLSGIGGLIGIGLGIGVATAISRIAKWPTELSTASMLIAFGFSFVIGVIFGYYPARRASRLDPISCLRHE